MYIIIAPIQIKEGHKQEFVAAMLEDAKGSLNHEPGCLRFDVVQDAGDPNRIWLYEVYVDEAAFQAHLQAPHFITWRDTVKEWRDEGPKGAARAATISGRPMGNGNKDFASISATTYLESSALPGRCVGKLVTYPLSTTRTSWRYAQFCRFHWLRRATVSVPA